MHNKLMSTHFIFKEQWFRETCIIIMITDEVLKEICDRIENTLENYVLGHKGQLFEDGRIVEEGMEGQIKRLYKSLLESSVIVKKGKMESLSNTQQEYVRKRIKKTLELSKNQYNS